MVRIFLDDERIPAVTPEEMGKQNWLIFRTGEQLQAFLIANPWMEIAQMSLDHDLGAGMTGYEFLSWYEEKLYNKKLNLPQKFTVHTWNASGRPRMIAAIDSILERAGEWQEMPKMEGEEGPIE